MDEKVALKDFLKKENYILRISNLEWDVLNNLFGFTLTQIFSKCHADNTDIESVLHCFGVAYVRKNMSMFRMQRSDALKVTKLFLLKKMLKIGKEKLNACNNERLGKINEAFLKNLEQCLSSAKSPRRTSDNKKKSSAGASTSRKESSMAQREKKRENRFVTIFKKLEETPATYEFLFIDSLAYLLGKYGVEIQENFLLDRLAEETATNYFKHARQSGVLDLSEIDPLVGDTSCQIRSIVLACMPILAEAVRDILNFDDSQVDRETKLFIGKCLMLTQKIAETETLEHIIVTIRQQTPLHLPKEWYRYLLIREGNLKDPRRIFIKLKRDVARESLNRLESLVTSLKWSTIREPLVDVFVSSKREKSSLGIEMAPLFVSAIAMLEIAKERKLPICMHVLNAVYHNENIEVLKWDLIFYVYSRELERFEKCEDLDASRLVIAIRNVWYEGSDVGLNYGENFMDTRFKLESYVETWKGHPELNTRMSEMRQRFLEAIIANQTQHTAAESFHFSGCFDYLKLKDEINTNASALDKMKRSSFMFVSHVYTSTVNVETNRSKQFNSMNWKPCEIKIKPPRVAQVKLYNRKYWEKRETALASRQIKKMSMQLNSKNHYDRKRSLPSKKFFRKEIEI